MAKRGKRKSKTAKKSPAKPSPEDEKKIALISGLETGSEKPKEAEQPLAPPQPEVPTFQPEVQMVNLRAKIHDVGMLQITVPAEKVDEVLEKIWQTGFVQKLNNRQRTHQVYGPHMIDRIDVEPIYT